MMKVSVSYLYGLSEGWDLASDSAYHKCTVLLVGCLHLVYHIIYNWISVATVGLSRDITTGNQCAPLQYSTSYPMQPHSSQPLDLISSIAACSWMKIAGTNLKEGCFTLISYEKLIREASKFIVDSSHHSWLSIVHWAWAERSSARERHGLLARATDFGHMTSPWQQCRSMRIIWQNGVSDTPTF